MAEILSMSFTLIFIENIVLTKFLGMCPILGVSKKWSSAFGMGLAVLFVIFGSSVITYFVYHQILVQFSIEYMDLLVFILIIAAFVQFVELFLKKISPALYKSLGIFLPLITTNCVVLYVTLENMKQGFNVSEMMTYSIAVSVGFMIVLLIFSTIRERLNAAATPKPFHNNAVAMVTLAFMSIIFSSLAGVI
ncbi:MAG: electron transport complex subunit RsxA [Erysipelothrix sp.]|nr:electron transport complex subunit RsxA [Erysipelothrix sp.]